MFRVLSFGRSLTPPDAAPLRLSFQKATGAAARPCASAAPMAEGGSKGKRTHQLHRSGQPLISELATAVGAAGLFSRSALERSDTMTALSIRAAAVSLAVVAVA